MKMYFRVFKAGSKHFDCLLEIYHAFDATDKSYVGKTRFLGLFGMFLAIYESYRLATILL